MGLIVDAVKLVFPAHPRAVGATIPIGTSGVPQYPRQPFYQYALAYAQNEVTYACTEELATSAAEPRLAAYVGQGKHAKKLDDHPVLQLFERPNPFLSRFSLIASIIMYRAVAGNAFLEKVRSRAGQVVELWPLRPDRVRVIPDRDKFISGYLYEIGGHQDTVPVADMIHSRTRNPNPYDIGSDFYGLPPLAVCAPRVETDVAMRAFTGAFFRNAGVPAGLLTIQRAVGQAERELIRNRFRGETGGPAGWHNMLVLDDSDAHYTPMGMALGERGLVLPELDEICEARIAMVFGVPLELIGARLGMIHGNRSTTKEARAGFWDETLSPLYVELAADLSMGLVDDFDSFDYLEFDTATVKALQEDEDSRHKRAREDLLAGLLTRSEARTALGYEPEPPAGSVWVLGTGVQELPEGAPVLAAGTAGQKALAGRPVRITNGDVARARAWAESLGEPSLTAALGGSGNGNS